MRVGECVKCGEWPVAVDDGWLCERCRELHKERVEALARANRHIPRREIQRIVEGRE